MKHATRVNNTAEVFTPRTLVRGMLDRLPQDVWRDPNKTWLEPSAGDGNFLVEIKARLLQAGHDERHILNHQLFSIELMDDNHFVLQQRLGYIQELVEEDGTYLVPGPALQDDLDFFKVSKIDRLTQDLNNFSPYAGKLVFIDGGVYELKHDEVYHHVNHRCMSALDLRALDFPGAKTVTGLPLRRKKKLSWKDVPDCLGFQNPEIGQTTVVSQLQKTWHIDSQQRNATPTTEITKAPTTSEAETNKQESTMPNPKPKPERNKKTSTDKKGGGWQVKAIDYGKHLKIRCKSPYDGSYWECDQDLLIDAINVSLKAKGKTLIGEPGPSEKVYGASAGLREQHLWTRV